MKIIIEFGCCHSNSYIAEDECKKYGTLFFGGINV